MKLSISTNFPQVQRQLQQLQKAVADKAVASALNKVVAQAKTAMSREIRSEFRVSAAEVGQTLQVTKASVKAGRLEVTLQVPPRRKGRGFNLIRFVEGSVTLAEAKRRAKAGTLNQLFVQIKKKGGRKGLGSAFIGNKGRTVFVRLGKERTPIKALTTVDIAQMFNTKRINRKVTEFIETKFPTVFANEAKFFTERFNAQR